MKDRRKFEFDNDDDDVGDNDETVKFSKIVLHCTVQPQHSVN